VAVVALNPRRQRKLWAAAFAMAISVILLAGVYIGAYVTGSARTLNQTFNAREGEFYTFGLHGTTWSMMRLSLSSSSPVTVCVTNGYGLEMLKSGRGTMCLFKADGVRNLNRVWRFPENGVLYLVVIPREKARVHLEVKTGLVLP